QSTSRRNLRPKQFALGNRPLPEKSGLGRIRGRNESQVLKPTERRSAPGKHLAAQQDHPTQGSSQEQNRGAIVRNGPAIRVPPFVRERRPAELADVIKRGNVRGTDWSSEGARSRGQEQGNRHHPS